MADLVDAIRPLIDDGTIIGFGMVGEVERTGGVQLDMEAKNIISFSPGDEPDTLLVNGQQMTYDEFVEYIRDEARKRDDADEG